MMVAIDRFVPDWRASRIHESSPRNGGLSAVLARDCKTYTASQYLPDVTPGTRRNGVLSENLEKQTFADAHFDLVVTQDVMEHVFHPDLAYGEIARTLRPGGYHIHTTPIYKNQQTTVKCAAIENGNVIHLKEPEYHGSPIGDGKSLVTFRYGMDLPDLIRSWAPFEVTIWSPDDKTQGMIGEFLDVIICRKLI